LPPALVPLPRGGNGRSGHDAPDGGGPNRWAAQRPAPPQT